VLDPEVVLRADGGAGQARRTVVLHGNREVAGQAVLAAKLAPFVRPALINGTAGVVVVVGGRLQSIMAFTVVRDRIAAIEVLLDPDRLKAVDLRALSLQDGGTGAP
jgi:RNA polymerase sigma-70 factor (ECF subfamily)